MLRAITSDTTKKSALYKTFQNGRQNLWRIKDVLWASKVIMDTNYYILDSAVSKNSVERTNKDEIFITAFISNFSQVSNTFASSMYESKLFCVWFGCFPKQRSYADSLHHWCVGITVFFLNVSLLLKVADIPQKWLRLIIQNMSKNWWKDPLNLLGISIRK